MFVFVRKLVYECVYTGVGEQTRTSHWTLYLQTGLKRTSTSSLLQALVCEVREWLPYGRLAVDPYTISVWNFSTTGHPQRKIGKLVGGSPKQYLLRGSATRWHFCSCTIHTQKKTMTYGPKSGEKWSWTPIHQELHGPIGFEYWSQHTSKYRY